MYKPPFSSSNYMIQEAILIATKANQISSFSKLNRMPVLRRNNKILSIHSSLAIEANSLSLEETRDIINGKQVLGPKREIQEVKNAYKAYEMMDDFDGYSQDDLLKAHAVLVAGIDEEAGQYRNHGEGVFDGKRLVFMAPPHNLVPNLMDDLFHWLKSDNETPMIIKSWVFLFEFVFIHPFGDGNGRTARLWQNVLLSIWNKVFEYVPLESQIKKYQQEYYGAIAKCHASGNSNTFIEFMLKMIDETLSDVLSSLAKEERNVSDNVNRLLDVMDYDIPLTANEIMVRLGIKSKETLRGSYLNPAIKNGLVKMTLPDKPKSKNQKYYK